MRDALPIAKLKDIRAERRDVIVLDALRDARNTIGIAAPVRVLGKIDHAIALLERAAEGEEASP